MTDNRNLPAAVNDVEAAMEKAKKNAKEERKVAFGALVDRAVEVLGDVLDTTDPAHANARMRAAEVAINLYIQQDSGDRQDRALDMQERRIQLEEAKLATGTVFNQQNNIYIDQRNGENPQQLSQEQQDQLAARKKATDALLASYLPKPPTPADSVDDVPTSDGDNTTT